MRRVMAKNILLTCWECGSSNVDLVVDGTEDTDFVYFVKCFDCGNKSLPDTTEKKAISGWNKAYTTSTGEPE